MTNGATESHAEPELLIAGRYRLAHRLGAGAFGRVWRAHDTQLAVDVAIKEVVLPPAMASAEQEERLRRAEREARNAARLRGHPHIVTVYDVVVQDGVPWTVMQLIEGQSLEDHVADHGPLSADRAAGVAEALLKALGAAHTAGIVHRDVKPANVMLGSDGGVLLTDFGIAVQQEDPRETATGTFIGSVEYVAPERARGQDAQPASDLFSLGATLYQAVEGISPFRRGSTVASLTAVLFEEQPAPQRAGRLTGLLDGLLAKDPADRFTIEQATAALSGNGVGASAPAEVAPTVSAEMPPAPTATSVPTPTSASGSTPASVPTPTTAPASTSSVTPAAPPTETAPVPSAVLETPAAARSGFRADPMRIVFPAVLIVLAIAATSLPTVKYYNTDLAENRYSGRLLSDLTMREVTPLREVGTVTQLVAIVAALVILAMLTARTGLLVRTVGYIATGLGVAAEVVQLVGASGEAYIPYTLTLRENWNDYRSPGAGTWFYWLFLAALLVLYPVRDVLTRRAARARRAVPAP